MQISLEQIQSWNTMLGDNPLNTLVMNAMGRVELNELAVNRELVKGVDFSFSEELEVAPEATAQQKVGVCWIFAAMNLLRYHTQKKIKVESFEYSGPYLMFWDKFEKANYFLEKMIQFRHAPYDNRVLQHFLNQPLPDGGDWYMFVNLVKKYGLVPASVMQHAPYSKDSTVPNQVFSSKLRYFAAEIRSMAQAGQSLEEIESARAGFMETLYQMMVRCFGVPPQRFDWSYRNKDKNFHRESDITPHEFVEKYVEIELDDYVNVWSSPLQDTPYGQLFSIAHTRQMVGGQANVALNIPFAELKQYALKKIQNHEPVVFSCDVLKESLRKEGLLLKGLYNYDLLFESEFYLERAQRLMTRDTSMTHCMLIVGVDVDDRGQPVKWKVENSWGADKGKKGYFLMSDDWFDEHVYQLIVPRKYLSPTELQILEQDPTELPLWHPMF